MSPVEWKEIHALAILGQADIAYDCEANCAAQVFVRTAIEPEEFRGHENLKAAFTALDDLAARTQPDEKNNGQSILPLSKGKMRQFLVVVRKAAESERRANSLHSAVPDKFPLVFPGVEVAAGHYADASADLVMALHENRPMSIGRPAV